MPAGRGAYIAAGPRGRKGSTPKRGWRSGSGQRKVRAALPVVDMRVACCSDRECPCALVPELSMAVSGLAHRKMRTDE